MLVLFPDQAYVKTVLGDCGLEVHGKTQGTKVLPSKGRIWRGLGWGLTGQSEIHPDFPR